MDSTDWEGETQQVASDQQTETVSFVTSPTGSVYAVPHQWRGAMLPPGFRLSSAREIASWHSARNDVHREFNAGVGPSDDRSPGAS